jgi:hypothetical protein
MTIYQAIIPTCRYGHGPLGRVDHKGEIPEWRLSAGNLNPAKLIFLVSLYVCETCGYSELFDLDPATTHREEVSK